MLGSNRHWASWTRAPEDRSSLEEACDVRLEMRPILTLLGETQLPLERLREAETIAERLNDDHRRARSCAFTTVVLSQLGKLDEALAYGTRALQIARRLGGT